MTRVQIGPECEVKREVFSEDVFYVLKKNHAERFLLNAEIWEARHAPAKLVPPIPGVTINDLAQIDFYRRMFAREMLFCR